MTHTQIVTLQGERYVAAMRLLAAATARHELDPTAETIGELQLSEDVARIAHRVLVRAYTEMDQSFPRASSALTRQIYLDAAAAQVEAFRAVLSGGEMPRTPLGLAARTQAA